MNTAILRREPVRVDATLDEVDLLLGDMDRQAREQLKYSGLHHEAVKLQTQASLEQTLAELDVRPFTPASVAAYKSKCERKANGPLGETVSTAAAFACLFCLLSLPALLAGALFGSTLVAFWSALAFVTTGALAIGGGVLSTRLGLERKWDLREISIYAEPIPAFALQTALDVKRACPQARFFICSLEEKQTVVDPFLVLRAGERDYYLEVWNESRFRGQREA